MSCAGNQCCAVVDNNTRCLNKVTNGSTHCETHREKAIKLYLAYKELSNRVDKLDLTKAVGNINERINYLTKCYVLINDTFKARMKHRKYAFVPECYDAGHDHQFTRLQDLTTQCEDMLAKLYAKISASDSSPKSESSSESSEDDVIEEVIIEEVKPYKKLRQQREKSEKDLDAWIEKYNEDNEEILRRREIMTTHIADWIFDRFDEFETETFAVDSFVQCVVMFNLTNTLYCSGYFLKNFVPNKCAECNCGQYIPYDVTLSCACIYENNTIFRYFSRSSEDTLKLFYEILLFNEAKILPLIADIVKLYVVFHDQIMFLKVHLDWKPAQKRLVLEQNLLPPQKKRSKIAATNRLKNKYYYQEMAKMKQTAANNKSFS